MSQPQEQDNSVTDARIKKSQLMRDAAMLTLKAQTLWHRPDVGYYNPSTAEIQKRIEQVTQYNTGEDLQMAAIKDLVLTSLSFKMELQGLRDHQSLRGTFVRFKKWLRRII